MNKKRFIDIIAFLFILLFVYTGASKFLDFERFRWTIEQVPILKPYANLIHWIIPMAEILIAIMLATGRFRLNGLYASFVMMLSFTIYVAAILQFSRQLPCSCGGVIQQMDWDQHLIFNIVFTLLAVAAIYLEKRSAKEKRNVAEVSYV